MEDRDVTAALPAHDLVTEQEAISAALLGGAPVVASLREAGLERHHFYLPEHAELWRASTALAEAGEEVDEISVRSWLLARDRLKSAGGASMLARVLSEAPALARPERAAERLILLARVRATDRWLAETRAQLAAGEGDHADRLARVQERLGDLEALATPHRRGIPTISAASVPPTPPAPPFVSRRLALAPGRPSCIVGYAGAGKTMLVADLALAVASAERAACWGGIPVERPGIVVHLDLEVGAYLTAQRYHRLAAGRWASLGEWGDRLRFASFPRWSLREPGAEASLRATLTGATLCVIDSLTMLLGGADENSSSVADALGLLARVSEATGCAILVLHHEGKPPADGPRAAHLRGRGSSAIQGLWSSQWAVSSPGAGRLVLEHGKNQWGPLLPSWSCQIEDVGEADASGQRPGVRLASLAASPEGEGVTAGAVQRAKRSILDVLAAFGPLSAGALTSKIKGNKDAKYRALSELVSEGRLQRSPAGKGVIFSLPRGDSAGGERSEDGFPEGVPVGFPTGETFFGDSSEEAGN